MMTPKRLFYRRLFSEIKFKFGIWKSVTDWTVVLYIIVPFIVLGVNRYVSWLIVPPEILYTLPRETFFTLCYLFAWFGTIRIFIQAGDQLFLWNRKKWIERIITYGIVYSSCFYFLMAVILFGLIAPFAYQLYSYSLSQLMWFFILTYLLKMVIAFVKQFTSLRFTGYSRVFVLSGLSIVFGMVFLFVIPYISENLILSLACTFVLIVGIISFAIKRIRHKHSFFSDVAREEAERLRSVQFLMGLSGLDIKSPKEQRKHPRIFRRSNPIFKKINAANGLVELCLKSTIRNKDRMLNYLQFVVIFLLILLSIQGGAKWLLWFSLSLIFPNFVGLYWKQTMASSFVRLFNWQLHDQRTSLQRFIYIGTLPGYLIISLAVGFQTYGIAGTLIIVPISIGLVYFMSKLVSLYFVRI